MTDVTKRKSLAYLTLAAILIMLIAAALPQLELNPGNPFQFRQNTTGALPTESITTPTISVSTFVRAMILIALALGITYCGFLMVRGTSFKELLRSVLSIMGLGVAASVPIIVIFALVHVHIALGSGEAEILPPVAGIDALPLGALPPFLIWLASAALALAILVLGYCLWRWRVRAKSDGARLGPKEVDQAVRALEMGSGPKNVIVHCYEQMSLALKQDESIDLAETMTAREFECLLNEKEIPRAPVHQLTRLFEAARYGYQPVTSGDEQVAIDCVRAIVRHMQTAGRRR